MTTKYIVWVWMNYYGRWNWFALTGEWTDEEATALVTKQSLTGKKAQALPIGQSPLDWNA